MMHRTVSDLMTVSVARVHPRTSFKEIVKLLDEYDISAVPVVDGTDHPVGVVSEADLLRTESGQPDPAGLLSARPGSVDRAVATTAGGLMTSPAVVAHPGWTVVQAAQVMDRAKVKRLPVVDEAGRLVGIVSRADLLRVFLRHDRVIREEISGDLLDRTLGITANEVTVRVVDGRVALAGVVRSRSQIPLVIRLCEGVDGVVEVTEGLTFRTDDMPASVTAGGPSPHAEQSR